MLLHVTPCYVRQHAIAPDNIWDAKDPRRGHLGLIFSKHEAIQNSEDFPVTSLGQY